MSAINFKSNETEKDPFKKYYWPNVMNCVKHWCEKRKFFLL